MANFYCDFFVNVKSCSSQEAIKPLSASKLHVKDVEDIPSPSSTSSNSSSLKRKASEDESSIEKRAKIDETVITKDIPSKSTNSDDTIDLTEDKKNEETPNKSPDTSNTKQLPESIIKHSTEFDSSFLPQTK